MGAESKSYEPKLESRRAGKIESSNNSYSLTFNLSNSQTFPQFVNEFLNKKFDQALNTKYTQENMKTLVFSLILLTFSPLVVRAEVLVNSEDPQSSIFQHLNEIGVLSSTPNPESIMTRSEALAVALRLGGIKIPEFAGQTFFADTDPNAWYAPFVARAVELDLLDTDTPNFRPNEAVNKAEFLAMLFRTTNVKLAAYAKAKSIATDIPDDAWFAPIFAYAKRYQIAELPADGLYHPLELLTRRRAAIMTFRMEKLFYGTEATKIFVELEAEIKQFISLLKSGDPEKAEMHLQRIVELNDLLARVKNNEEAVAAKAISMALSHFSESLRAMKSGDNLSAIESLYLAAKQTERALAKSENIAPFARDFASVIDETLLTFHSAPAYMRLTQK